MSQNGAREVVSKHCRISSSRAIERPLRRSKLYLDLIAPKSRAILWYKRCSPRTKDRSFQRIRKGITNRIMAASQIGIGAWTQLKGGYETSNALNVTVLFPRGVSISPVLGLEDVRQHRSKMVCEEY